MKCGVISMVFVLAITVTLQADPITEALDQADADSQVLVVAPKLLDLSDKIAMVADQFGGQMSEFRNILGQFKRTTGLSRAVRDDAAAMIALTIVVGDDGTTKWGRALLVLPVSNYAAMVQSLGGDGLAPVTEITLASGHKAYAKKSAGFALIGSDQQTFSQHRSAKAAARLQQQLGEVAVDNLRSADLALIVRGPNKERTIRHIANSMAAGVIKLLTPSGDKTGFMSHAPMGLALWNKTLDQRLAADLAVWRDADAVLLALHITDEGIALAACAQFKPASPIAGALSSGGGVRALARLPAMAYLTATAISFQGIDIAALRSAWPGLALMPDWLGQTLGQVARSGNPVTSYAQVRYASATLGLAGPPIVRYIETDDPEQLVAAMRKSIEALDSPNGATSLGLNSTMHYTPDQMRLGDHRVDQYFISQNVEPPEQQPQMLQQIRTMTGLSGYGSDTIGYLLALDNLVVVTETTDRNLLRKVVEAAGQDNGLADDTHMAVSRKGLSDDSAIQMYLDLRSVFNLVRHAPLLATQQQMPEPDDVMAPLALGVKVHEHSVALRVFVPRSVTDYGAQLIDYFKSQRAQSVAESRQPQQRRLRPQQPRRGPRRAPRPVPRRGPQNPPGILPGIPPEFLPGFHR